MEKNKLLNIAIADDHAMFRKGTIMLLEANNFTVSIEAENGQDLIEKISANTCKPDICLLDVRMPIMDAYQAIPLIKKQWSAIKILIVSTHDHEHVIISMLKKGANGYLLKSADPEELFLAINQIHQSGYYHSDLVPEYFSKVIEISDLNDREMQFLRLCSEELTYKQISQQMTVSERTIESYRNALFSKLKVQSRTGLVMFAVKNGII